MIEVPPIDLARVKATFVVLGRGREFYDGVPQLSTPSAERVGALSNYLIELTGVERPPDPSNYYVIYSSNSSAASKGEPVAPLEDSEAYLMQRYGNKLGIDAYATTDTEPASGSTLQNALECKRLLSGATYTNTSPLVLVMHRDHLPRSDFFFSRVFDGANMLQGDVALRYLVVENEDQPEIGIGEKRMMAVTRLAFVGTHRDETLLRRERVVTVGFRLYVAGRKLASKAIRYMRVS